MKILSPFNLLLISFLLWLISFLTVPVTFGYEGSIFFPVTILFLLVLFFMFGLISIKSNKRYQLKQYHSKRKIKQIVFFLFVLGFIGVCIKIYIGFFKTEIFTAEDVFLKRLEGMSKELKGGGMGIIGALLYPFSFICLLITIYHYKFFSNFFIVFIIIFGVYPFLETIFLGGRTTMVLLGFNLIFICILSFFKNSKTTLTVFKLKNKTIFKLPSFFLKKTFYIPLTVFALIFISYSIKVVNKRVTTYGYKNNVFKAWEKRDHQWVKFDSEFKKEYFSSNKERQARMLGLYGLKRYFALGPVEFVRLYNHLDSTTGYYYGQYQFNVFFKFFKFFKIPIKSFTELNEILERKAVYTTFWGPFYIDFGIFGIFIMFFWGRFVKRCYCRAMLQKTEYVIFYGFIATILLSSFFFNSMMGSSTYFLFSYLITILIFKYFPTNLKITFKKNNKILVCVFVAFASCNVKNDRIITTDKNINDSLYVVNRFFKKGDVRRYGVFSNQKTKASFVDNLHKVIEKGVPVKFNKGFYYFSLNLKGVEDALIYFDDSFIAGGLNIIESKKKPSKNITISGKLTVLDKVFIRKSRDICFDELKIVSDTINNINKKNNRGLNIYAGSENISFNSVYIENSGGNGGDYYKYSSAALQIYGWNNNPKNIKIDTLKIYNSERTAAYVTGENHTFKDVFIKKYGNGNEKNIFPLDDAKLGQEKIFSGLWLNKCNNCNFDKVTVITDSSRFYALKLGLGLYNKPTIIKTLVLDKEYKDELILDDLLTNILVKKIIY